jgi:uncharacterized protein YjiS (DUF1127 family)
MRIDHYQPGEVLRATDRPAAIARTASFGRIGRRRPAATVDVAPPSMQLHAGARAHRERVVGDLVAVVVRAVTACVRSLAAAWQRQREVRAAVNALRGLDTRTWHDLAIPGREIPSVALDTARAVETDRLRTAPAHHHLRLS